MGQTGQDHQLHAVSVILSGEFNFPELLKMAAEEGQEEGNEVEQGIATQHPGTSLSALQLMIPPTTARPSNDPRLPTSK